MNTTKVRCVFLATATAATFVTENSPLGTEKFTKRKEQEVHIHGELELPMPKSHIEQSIYKINYNQSAFRETMVSQSARTMTRLPS